MYAGDWLTRLTELVRDSKSPGHWHVPANVWGLGVTSMLTDVSSEMVLSVLPAYLVISGGLAPLALGVAAGVHEGGPMLAAWAGGLIADRVRKAEAHRRVPAMPSRRSAPRVVRAFGESDCGHRPARARRPRRQGNPEPRLVTRSSRSASVRTSSRPRFGVHRALDAAGAALGPLLAFVLLWRFPHRYDVIFFASFVVALLGVAALALLVDEAPPHHREVGAERIRVTSRDVLTIFGDPSIRPVLILATAFALVTISDAFIYLLLVQRSHAGPQWIPLL